MIDNNSINKDSVADTRTAERVTAPSSSSSSSSSSNQSNTRFRRPSKIHRTVSRMDDGNYRVKEMDETDMSCFEVMIDIGDVFGYDPEAWSDNKKSRVKHACGFFATIFLVAGMILMMVLGINEFQDGMTLIFDGDVISKRSVQLPDDFQTRMGVYCCGYSYNPNNDACNTTGFLDITWQQRGIKNQDHNTKTKVTFASKSCYFQLSSNGIQQLSYCPVSNAFELKGNYNAEEYKYIQVNIAECSNSSSSSVTCKSPTEIQQFQEEAICSFVIGTTRPDVNKIKNSGMAEADYEEHIRFDSERFYFIKDQIIRIEVYLQLLVVQVESWIVHVKSWIQSSSFLVYDRFEAVQSTKPSYDSDKIITFYFLLSESENIIMITPFLTLVKLLGSWGSFFTLFLSVTAGAVFISNLYIHHQSVDEVLDKVGLKRFKTKNSLSEVVPLQNMPRTIKEDVEDDDSSDDNRDKGEGGGR